MPNRLPTTLEPPKSGTWVLLYLVPLLRLAHFLLYRTALWEFAATTSNPAVALGPRPELTGYSLRVKLDAGTRASQAKTPIHAVASRELSRD